MDLKAHSKKAASRQGGKPTRKRPNPASDDSPASKSQRTQGPALPPHPTAVAPAIKPDDPMQQLQAWLCQQLHPLQPAQLAPPLPLTVPPLPWPSPLDGVPASSLAVMERLLANVEASMEVLGTLTQTPLLETISASLPASASLSWLPPPATDSPSAHPAASLPSPDSKPAPVHRTQRLLPAAAQPRLKAVPPASKSVKPAPPASTAAKAAPPGTKSSKATPTSTSGTFTSLFRGVTRHRTTGRYEAHIWDADFRPSQEDLKLAQERVRQKKKAGASKPRQRGRQIYLGAFEQEEDAARVYDRAALCIKGPAAPLNFPLEQYADALVAMAGKSREEVVGELRRGSVGFARGQSQYRGVTKHHQLGRWEARIGRLGQDRYCYLGTYMTAREAAVAFDKAAVKFKGKKAITNFPQSNYADILADPDSYHPEVEAEMGGGAPAAPMQLRQRAARMTAGQAPTQGQQFSPPSSSGGPATQRRSLSTEVQGQESLSPASSLLPAHAARTRAGLRAMTTRAAASAVQLPPRMVAAAHTPSAGLASLPSPIHAAVSLHITPLAVPAAPRLSVTSVSLSARPLSRRRKVPQPQQLAESPDAPPYSSVQHTPARLPTVPEDAEACVQRMQPEDESPGLLPRLLVPLRQEASGSFVSPLTHGRRSSGRGSGTSLRVSSGSFPGGSPDWTQAWLASPPTIPALSPLSMALCQPSPAHLSVTGQRSGPDQGTPLLPRSAAHRGSAGGGMFSGSQDSQTMGQGGQVFPNLFS